MPKLAEIQARFARKRKFYVVCYMRVEPEDIELMTFKEAKAEIENLKLMQPENIYTIQDIDNNETG